MTNIIDWDKATEQVRNDIPFLKEIIHDLYNEAVSCSDRILNGINTENFSVIVKAAHTVKGSASYFYCTDLIAASIKLLELGREGIVATEGNAEGKKEWMGLASRDILAIWSDIDDAYRQFGKCVQALGADIEVHFKHLNM